MGAEDQDSDGRERDPASGGERSGPAGWEAARVDLFWKRVEAGIREGRPICPRPGERVRIEDRPSPLPPASALERLVRDVLDAAYGPTVEDGVPDRRSERRRIAARLRLVRRLRAPVRRRRFQRHAREVLDELNRRARTLAQTDVAVDALLYRTGVGDGPADRALDDLNRRARRDETPGRSWVVEALRRAGVGAWIEARGGVPRDALLGALCVALDRALHGALSDPRVAEASPRQLVEDAAADRLRGRLRSALADALLRDLASSEAARAEEPPANWPERLGAVDDPAAGQGEGQEKDRPDPLTRPDPGSAHLERRRAAFRGADRRGDARRRLEQVFAALHDDEEDGERAVLGAVLAWWRRHPWEEELNVSAAYREAAADLPFGRRTFARRWDALRDRLRGGA